MKNIIIMFKKLGFLLVLLYSWQVTAQDNEEGKGIVMIYPTQKGNLVRILAKNQSREEFSAILKNTAYFEIKRGRVVTGTEKFETVGKAKRAESTKEFSAILGAEQYNDFKRISARTTEGQVADFLKNEYNIDTLSLYSEMSKEFLQGVGLGFFDTQAPRDTIYSYEAIRKDINGTEEVWGGYQVGSKIPNPMLSKIVYEADSIITSDSVALFKFVIKLPSVSPLNSQYPALEELSDSLPIEEYMKAYNEQREQIISFLNTKDLTYDNTRFRIEWNINDNPVWKQQPLRIATADSSGKYLISLFLRTNPEDKVTVRIIPEDYAGATGTPSKDFSAYAISKGTVPIIYGLFGNDSTNCIQLTWSQLPSKPYYAGLLLEREAENQPIKQLAILDPKAVKFDDYEIEPGITYSYSIRALFNPKQNVTQDMPASVSLSGNKFSAPLPPFNLQVDSTSKEYPTLTWDAVESKSRFAFFVYRGLSPDALELVSPTLKENKFTDTTASFSGKLSYYYAVLEQNLTQDTSAFSNIVMFQPPVPYEVVPPTFVNATIMNGEVLLDWDDIRNRDAYVGGYQVERRVKGQTAFDKLTDKPITTNYFTDTTFVRGTIYEYRVSSVALNNLVGASTMPTEVNFPMESLPPPAKINLMNGKDGVVVSWPGIEVDRVKEYVIYRSGPNGMQVLGRVPKGKFKYEDTTVTPNEAYTYAVSIVDISDREGLKSTRKSINRQLPKSL